jgi:hypothetical protein
MRLSLSHGFIALAEKCIELSHEQTTPTLVEITTADKLSRLNPHRDMHKVFVIIQLCLSCRFDTRWCSLPAAAATAP